MTTVVPQSTAPTTTDSLATDVAVQARRFFYFATWAAGALALIWQRYPLCRYLASTTHGQAPNCTPFWAALGGFGFVAGCVYIVLLWAWGPGQHQVRLGFFW